MIIFKYAILCDLVRREDTGKFLLIGVYTGGLRFLNKGPMNLQSLTAFVCFSTKLLHLDITFRISNALDRSAAHTDAVLERVGSPDSEEEVFLPVPFTNVELSEGKHYLEYRLKNEGWARVLEFDVGIQPDAAEVS